MSVIASTEMLQDHIAQLISFT